MLDAVFVFDTRFHFLPPASDQYSDQILRASE